MTDVLGKVTDVQQTLSYGSAKMGRRFLELGLVSLAAGGVIAWLGLDTPMDWLMAAAGIVLGAGCALYGLDRWLRPKALVTLSPAGLRLHLDMLKTVHIPWHEVRGVDTIDITGTFRGHAVLLPGVTVVLVTRAFYDRHIHVSSWILRGPGWDTNFIPKGDLVQVALHHEALDATAAELREAVESRWKAFRDAKPADQKSAPATPTGPRIFGGFRRK